MKFASNENEYKPQNENGRKWRTSIGGFAKRVEITPLGGGSKISEEDLPL